MNELLTAVKRLIAPKDCQAIIAGDTLMLACGLSPAEVKDVCSHGVQRLSAVIDAKVGHKTLSDEIFLDHLLGLSTNDLDQLPTPFLTQVVQSVAFKTLPRDRQNDAFRKIFAALKIPTVDEISQLPPEQVAYNYPQYTALFHAFFALNMPNQRLVQQQDLYVQKLVGQQLQAMLDKAPALRDPAVRASLRATGDVTADAEKALQNFTTTQGIDQATINDLNLGQAANQAVTNAKVVLAEYELGAYAAAAKQQGIMDAKATAQCTILDPKEKSKPLNQFVKAGKQVLANFTKPQNLAKLGFRQVATQAVQHLTEGAIPGVGAVVGLAMKLGECGKKILLDKKPAREVFATAAPDLVRGVITVGTSITPLAPIAGTLGTVASIAVKGIAAAHEAGYPVGKDFLKRVGKEFTKKGNLLNLGASVLGTAVGAGAKKVIDHFRGADDATEITDEINGEDTTEVTAANLVADHDATVTTAVPETNLDYTDAYLAAHPGAHLDANGWVQNADGSYARNADGQLFGSADRTFRAVGATETLDQAGNIVNNATGAKDELSEEMQDAITKAQASMDAVYREYQTAETTAAEQEIADLQRGVSAVDDEIARHERNLADQQALSEQNAQDLAETQAEIAKAQEYQALLERAMAGQGATVTDAALDEVMEAATADKFAASDDKFAKIEQQIAASNAAAREKWAAMTPAEREAIIIENTRKNSLEYKFNSLPTEQQQELIALKAKAMVAQEQGDTATYQALKEQFTTRQEEMVSADSYLDQKSARANIKGTNEWRLREADRTLLPEQDFTAMYGKYQGVKDGVAQYVREDGYYQMKLPTVAGVADQTPIDPQRNATTALQDAIEREREQAQMQDAITQVQASMDAVYQAYQATPERTL